MALSFHLSLVLSVTIPQTFPSFMILTRLKSVGQLFCTTSTLYVQLMFSHD